MTHSTRLALALLRTAPAVADGADVTSRSPGPAPVDSTVAMGGAPNQAVLLFTDNLDPGSVSVTLTAASGVQVSLASPEVAGKTVLQPLSDLPAGPSTLTYRVRCEDGQWADGAITVDTSGGLRPAAATDRATASSGTTRPGAIAGAPAAGAAVRWRRPESIAVRVGLVVLGTATMIAAVARERAH